MNHNQPGCFGSIINFSSTDTTCSSCPFSADCEDKAYTNLLEMREFMDVSEFEKKFNIHRINSGKEVVNEAVQKTGKRVRRSRLKDWQLEIINDVSLPSKPRVLIKSIFTKGYGGQYLNKAVKSGINPFRSQTPVILELVFDLLLTGGFTKSQLHATYMSTGMAKRTAHSQVSIVVAVLAILEVTKENKQSGLITIKGDQ